MGTSSYSFAMCDIQKEFNNATNSVSNALGTDGSKNGLLNDPLSMAALGVGAAIATGGLSLGATEAAAAATGTAATEAALIPLEVIAPLGSSAVASVTAGTAATTAATAAGASWLDALLTPANAIAVGKVALPAIAQNATNQNNLNAAKDLLAIQTANAQRANTALTGQLGSNLAGSVGTQASKGTSYIVPAIAVVVIAVVATKLLKHK